MVNLIKPVSKVKEGEEFVYTNYKPESNLRTTVYYPDEIFVDVHPMFGPGFMISNYGRLYNKNTGYLVQQSNAKGYMQVKINRYTRLTHRIVLQSFSPIENPENYQVNHKNAVKSNRKLDNLEWVTSRENMLHAYEHNLEVQGEDHPWSKFTEEQISIICDCLEKRLPYRDICNILGISYNKNNSQLITSIRSKRNWKSVSTSYDLPDLNSNKQIFTNDEIRKICEYFEKGYSTNKILREMNVKLEGSGKYDDNENIYEVIGKIRRRSTFTDISKDYNF